jgi:hypothetical protein
MRPTRPPRRAFTLIELTDGRVRPVRGCGMAPHGSVLLPPFRQGDFPQRWSALAEDPPSRMPWP